VPGSSLDGKRERQKGGEQVTSIEPGSLFIHISLWSV
jgi:hypothetical protein